MINEFNENKITTDFKFALNQHQVNTVKTVIKNNSQSKAYLLDMMQKEAKMAVKPPVTS